MKKRPKHPSVSTSAHNAKWDKLSARASSLGFTEDEAEVLEAAIARTDMLIAASEPSRAALRFFSTLRKNVDAALALMQFIRKQEKLAAGKPIREVLACPYFEVVLKNSDRRPGWAWVIREDLYPWQRGKITNLGVNDGRMFIKAIHLSNGQIGALAGQKAPEKASRITEDQVKKVRQAMAKGK